MDDLEKMIRDEEKRNARRKRQRTYDFGSTYLNKFIKLTEETDIDFKDIDILNDIQMKKLREKNDYVLVSGHLTLVYHKQGTGAEEREKSFCRNWRGDRQILVNIYGENLPAEPEGRMDNDVKYFGKNFTYLIPKNTNIETEVITQTVETGTVVIVQNGYDGQLAYVDNVTIDIIEKPTVSDLLMKSSTDNLCLIHCIATALAGKKYYKSKNFNTFLKEFRAISKKEDSFSLHDLECWTQNNKYVKFVIVGSNNRKLREIGVPKTAHHTIGLYYHNEHVELISPEDLRRVAQVQDDCLLSIKNQRQKIEIKGKECCYTGQNTCFQNGETTIVNEIFNDEFIATKKAEGYSIIYVDEYHLKKYLATVNDINQIEVNAKGSVVRVVVNEVILEVKREEEDTFKQKRDKVYKDYPYENIQETRTFAALTTALSDCILGQIPKSYYNEEVRQLQYTHFVGPRTGRVSNEEEEVEVDLKRCYRNILYDNKHPFPIFQSVDSFVRIGEISSTDVVPGEYIVAQPFEICGVPIGAGILNYVLIKKALECWEKGHPRTTKPEISHVMKARRTIKADTFKPLLKYITEELDDIKRMPNELTGLLNKRIRRETATYLEKNEQQVYFQMYHNFDKGIKTKLINVCKNVNIVHETKEIPLNSCHSSIYRQIIHQCFLRLAEINFTIDDYSSIVAYKTDAVFYKNTDSLVNVNKLPFTIHVSESYSRLKKPVKVKKSQPLPKEAAWNNVTEVNTEENCLVTGMPGCGKTTLLCKLYEKFVSEGKSVVCLAFTNFAVSNLKDRGCNEAYTLDSYFFKRKTTIKKYDVYLIDEFSTISAILMGRLIKHCGGSLVYLFGDPNQLPSVAENNYNYVNNKVICQWMKNFYKMKYIEASGRYDNKMKEILEKFTEDGVLDTTHFKDIDWSLETNITFTNELRKKINHQHSASSSQKIIATKNVPPKIFNSQIFKRIGENTVLRNEKTIELTDIQIINAEFEPAYAITSHKIQGTTLEEDYNIHVEMKPDGKTPYFNRNALYVALSRCKTADQIHITQVNGVKFHPEKEDDIVNMKLRKPEKALIYKIYNKDGSEYVGSTVCGPSQSEKARLEKRFKEHERDETLAWKRNMDRIELLTRVYYHNKEEIESRWEKKFIGQITVECNNIRCVSKCAPTKGFIELQEVSTPLPKVNDNGKQLRCKSGGIDIVAKYDGSEDGRQKAMKKIYKKIEIKMNNILLQSRWNSCGINMGSCQKIDL